MASLRPTICTMLVTLHVLASLPHYAFAAGRGGPPSGSPYGTGGSDDDGDGFFGPASGTRGSSSSGGFGPPGAFGRGFDADRAELFRLVHGVLLAIVFVGVLPSGAILVRLPFLGRFGVWSHAACQMLGWALGAAGLGLGAWMVANIKPFGRTLFSIDTISYHLIIGLVALALLLLPQPILGILHHLAFRRLNRRTSYSHLHLWNGRFLITLGIVNGGLGLYVARASRASKIAYGVVAGIMGLLWLLAAVLGEARRRRAVRKESPGSPGESPRMASRGGRGAKEGGGEERYS